MNLQRILTISDDRLMEFCNDFGFMGFTKDQILNIRTYGPASRYYQKLQSVPLMHCMYLRENINAMSFENQIKVNALSVIIKCLNISESVLQEAQIDQAFEKSKLIYDNYSYAGNDTIQSIVDELIIAHKDMSDASLIISQGIKKILTDYDIQGLDDLAS